MGYLFIILTIAMAITGLVWVAHKNSSLQASNTWFTAVLCGIAGLLLYFVPFGVSYNTYLSLRESQATVENYRDAIDLYSERGMYDFQGGQMLGAGREITDLKYMSYQEQMANLIENLKVVVVKHNKTLACKKAMKDSLMWNWVIYLPEDMKPLPLVLY